MKSWIALLLAVAAGGGIGWFVGFGMGHKRGRKEALEKVAWEQAGEIDDANF